LLGERLDRLTNKGEEIISRLEGKIDRTEVTRLRNVIRGMRKVCVRWVNLYHNERHQAMERIKELEK
jgi:hypothetical protein